MEMLNCLTQAKATPKLPVRATEFAVGYMFGDASEGGFGTVNRHVGLDVRDLGSETSKQSSNFREYRELCETDRAAPQGQKVGGRNGIVGVYGQLRNRVCVSQGNCTIEVPSQLGPTTEEDRDGRRRLDTLSLGSRHSNDRTRVGRAVSGRPIQWGAGREGLLGLHLEKQFSTPHRIPAPGRTEFVTL
jgi:hypothetical protein